MAQTRKAIREIGGDGLPFTADEVMGRMDDVRTYEKAKRVRSAIGWLKRTGEVASVRRGVYWYIGDGTEGRTCDVRDRILRAMYVKRLFTARDIIILSDAEKSYVNAMIRELVAAGEIVAAGKVPGKLQRVRAYRARNPREFFLKYVRGETTC